MTELRSPQPLDPRACLIALMMSVPVVITACGLIAMEAWRWVRPDSVLFTTPVRASLAEAIARDDVQGAFGFLRAGQNPNDVIAVSDPELTGGRRVEVRPLIWAVATQSEGAVGLLMGHGARLDAVTTRNAVCLAEQLDRRDIVRLLLLTSRDASPEPCPARKGDDKPLLTGP